MWRHRPCQGILTNISNGICPYATPYFYKLFPFSNDHSYNIPRKSHGQQVPCCWPLVYSRGSQKLYMKDQDFCFVGRGLTILTNFSSSRLDSLPFPQQITGEHCPVKHSRKAKEKFQTYSDASRNTVDWPGLMTLDTPAVFLNEQSRHRHSVSLSPVQGLCQRPCRSRLWAHLLDQRDRLLSLVSCLMEVLQWIMNWRWTSLPNWHVLEEIIFFFHHGECHLCDLQGYVV